MLIISVTEQNGKFHYVYRDMTTGLLINIHCLSSLLTPKSWVNFVSLFYLVQTSFKEFGEVGLSTLRVYKVFTKTGRGR